MFKQLIGFRAKYFLLLQLQRFKPLSFFKDIKIDGTRHKAYIFLAADYGNLGDVAITYAQTKFLKEFSNRQVIEIPISKSLEGLWFVKKNIKKGDIVTTVGGGNMGDLYDQIEFIRQLTFQWFPNNRIISFPQTFDFTDSKEGRKALKQAKKVYNDHKDLHLVAREQTSYELMKKHFTSANVLLTPDIVLSLNETEPKQHRSGVVICMRKDAEKSLTPEQNNFIIQSAESHFGELKYYDTHIGRNSMSVEERLGELNKIWQTFRNAELVITDRLHGMIFCYITNTPCLVFQNNNHKVKETHYWIQNSNYVTLMPKFSEDNIVQYFEKERYKDVSNRIELDEKYQPIVDTLKS